MASIDAQTAADNAAIEDYRAKFGDAEAAKFASQVYILRQTQAAASNSGWARFPRWIVILLALWFALLETADKVPQLVLSLPKFEADLAEYEAKPALVRVGLQKATEDAKTAHVQNCDARLNLTINGKGIGLMPSDPKFRSIIDDCREYLSKNFIDGVEEGEHRAKEDQEQDRKEQEEAAREAAKPRSYEECLGVVAARRVLAGQATKYHAARDELASAGPSDPEIAECMKLSKAQASALDPKTLSECRDWWIARLRERSPDLVLSEIAEEAALMEQHAEKEGKQGFVARCMAGERL